jgi:hypothetical protein
MKFPQILALAACLLAASCAPAYSAVIAGWDNWDGYVSATTSYTADQAISGFTARLSVAGDRVSATFNSNDGTFGTTAGAATTGDALILSQQNNALTVTLTLINNTGSEYSLSSIGFDFAPRTNAGGDAGPRSFALSYVSGNLGTGPVAIGSQSSLPIWIANTTNVQSNFPDYDLALSPALSDTTLANGEQAVFTLVLSNFTQASVGSVLDNVAIVGNLVPEPGGGVLALAGGLCLSARRRRAPGIA